MKQYVIYDQIRGVHTTVDTVEEARQLQVDFLREYILNVVVGMYSCNVVTTNDDGTKTWVGFDLKLEKEIPDILKELVKTSIVEHFGAGNLIEYEMVRQVLIDEGLIKEEQAYDVE